MLKNITAQRPNKILGTHIFCYHFLNFPPKVFKINNDFSQNLAKVGTYMGSTYNTTIFEGIKVVNEYLDILVYLGKYFIFVQDLLYH